MLDLCPAWKIQVSDQGPVWLLDRALIPQECPCWLVHPLIEGWDGGLYTPGVQSQEISVVPLGFFRVFFVSRFQGWWFVFFPL